MNEQQLQASVDLWEYTVLAMSIAATIATTVAAFCAYRAYVWNNRRRNIILTEGGLETFKRIDARSSRYEKLSQITSLTAATVALFGVLGSVSYTVRNHQLQNLENVERRGLADQATNAVQRLTEATNQETASAAELKAAYQDLATTKIALDLVEKRTDPRTLTESQIATLMPLLKRAAPQEFYLIRAPNLEAQRYADAVSSVLISAGWKPVTPPDTWGTLLTYPEGVEILLSVNDLQKAAPAGAASLQAALEQAGIEVRRVSYDAIENGKFALYIGPKPTPTK